MRMIGAHVSASGGLDRAVERAKAIGCNALQIFSGSPRVWKRKPLAEIDPKKMFAKQQELGIDTVFTHSLYLVNLASEKPELVQSSVRVLQYDLAFDSKINGSGVVVHLGSHLGTGWERVREAVAERITTILAATPDNSTFLIENSAGQKGKLCSELSEIKWLLEQVASPRLGWCFDTCHAHAAGLSIGETEESLLLPQPSAISEITRLSLWDTLRCIHVNDSRDAFGSGRDRHANLGQGNISLQALSFFLNRQAVRSIPLILEVPGLDGMGPDAANVSVLKQLVEEN